MWVYQEASHSEILPASPAILLPEKLPAAATGDLAEPQPNASMQQNAPQADAPCKDAVPQRIKSAQRAQALGGRATKDCILLAAAYLFGTMLAGVLQALCDANELDMLSYYLNCWRSMFTIDGAETIALLFGAEYLTAAGAITVLLLLGLSALGPTLIFLFVMLYGTGAGLLVSQLFSGLTVKLFAVYLVAAGVPAAVAAGCLCLFGASALQVCVRLHSFSFAPRGGSFSGVGARLLVGQYFLFAVLMLPLCGAATGLVCLANRFL